MQTAVSLPHFLTRLVYRNSVVPTSKLVQVLTLVGWKKIHVDDRQGQ